MSNLSSTSDGLVESRLVGKRCVADGVVEFRFRDMAGQPYPGTGPGAHIDVLTPAGERRSYSLTRGARAHAGEYVIAVALDPNSRGGSHSMHHDTSIGMVMRISPPIDTFALTPASEYLLIAGGIGITPIRSMFHEIRKAGAERVRLVYLTRTRSAAAYLDELLSYAGEGTEVIIHATDEHAGERFDLWSVLDDPADRHVYCCASPAVLESVRLLTAHWRPSRVHFEDFAGVSAVGEFAVPFTAIWEPTGAEVKVAADQSLLDALLNSGIQVPESCRTGTCGTCRVRVLAGEIDHRDVALDSTQRKTSMTSCVSRGAGTIRLAPAAPE